MQRRPDAAAIIAEKIKAQFEKGVRPWMRPWDAGNTAGRIMRPLRSNGQPYSGINILMLWAEAADKGYASPTWMTLRQANSLEAHVRKGEHGSIVVYADSITKKEEKDGEALEREIHFLKTYTVFNVEQIEGLPEQYYAKPPVRLTPIERIAHAEAFVQNTKADIRIGGNRAYYAAEPDHIRLPPIEAFRDTESFYATELHELMHWTRHETRLSRDFRRKAWGDEGYAREEIVAELGAALACCELDITPEVREDHASYISSWLNILNNDKRFIIESAAHAQRAADYLFGLQP
jgi:antirestriction protein ArdC